MTLPRRAVCLAFLAGSAVTGGCARGNERDATLVAAITTDPGQLNPAITTNGSVHTAAVLLYDGLLTLGEDLVPRPALAASWEILDGGARYRFMLRRDVKWHDGQPFTAADVKFSFDSLLLRFHARTRASMAPAILSIDTPDDYTVEFRFKRPYAPLLQQLDVVEAPIVPRHVFAGSDPMRNPANRAPVGTGPFRFVSYSMDREIRYAANRDYFAGAPTIDAVILRVIPDAGTQVAALEAGEVDWLFGVPAAERQRLRADSRFRMIQTAMNPGGSNCVTTIGFNLDRPWARDFRVRRAIAHAVDRRQFHERVAFGEGRVADAPISSRISFAHAAPITMPAFDTAMAARLLDDAGWSRQGSEVRAARGVPGVRDGTPFVIGFLSQPGQTSVGDLFRAQLRAVGIDVRVAALEPGVFGQVVFTSRDFDTAVVSYCNGTDPEIGVRRQYVSSNIAPVPFSNLAAYRNPVMDSLFDRAGSTLDRERRRALYQQIQELAVRDQPYLWLLESENTRVYSARCGNFASAAHFAATARCAR